MLNSPISTTFVLLCWIGPAIAGEAPTLSLAMDTESAKLEIAYESRLGHRYALHESTDLLEWSRRGPVARGSGDSAAFQIPLDELAPFYQLREAMDVAIQSQITGVEYPINLYVPESYESNDRLYPVVYATDGQWITESFAGFIREEGKDVILVTIEQGPGDRRAIDYRYPGVLDYYKVLTTELIPAVESLYRVDSNDRSLCGTSYGGLLVGLVMMLERPESQFFHTYLSFDGSFYDRRPRMLELMRERYNASPRLKARLFLTSATVYPNNHAIVNAF